MGTSNEATSVPRLVGLFGARQLPVRVPPLPDEIFSSWFVRVARANGLRVHHLERGLLGRDRPLFAGDPDRGVRQDHGKELAALMSISEQAAIGTYLNSYVSYVWDAVPDCGVWQNVLPIANQTRRLRLPGFQFCPECLKEDSQPYFRKYWRLAFCVICDLHNCHLLDRCPSCGASVVLHKINAQNRYMKDLQPMTSCFECGGSLTGESVSVPSTRELADFQRLLLMTLNRGWISIAGNCIHSVLYFQGLRMLISFFEDSKLSAEVAESLMPGVVQTGERLERYGGYEVSGLKRRTLTLELVRRLLLDGPSAAAERLKTLGMGSRNITRFHRGKSVAVPFWLWEPMHFSIDGTPYTPHDQEIERAMRYVLRATGELKVGDICRVLNLKTTSNLRVAKARDQLLRRIASADAGANASIT